MESTKKRIFVSLLSLVLSVALIAGFMPATAYGATTEQKNTIGEAVQLIPGQTVNVGGVSSSTVDYSTHMFYKFTVSSPSYVTFDFSVSNVPNLDNRTNSMRFNAIGPNNSQLYADQESFGKSYNIILYSDAIPLSKTINYKLLAGTYYVELYEMGSLNSNSSLTLRSITPMKEDTLGEPNDSLTQALNRIVKPSVTYSGNINYYGKATNNHGKDKADYFKLTVPQDNSTIRLSASRNDTNRENNISVMFCNEHGTNIQSGKYVKLIVSPSGSVTYTGVKKGTYFIYVEGWPANAYCTEYTFRVDNLTPPPPAKIAATKIKLNKSKLKIKKGRSYKLKVTRFYPSNVNPKKIIWKSSNKKVVKVNSKTGKIKAVKKGKATIYAKTWNGKVAKCRVTVK